MIALFQSLRGFGVGWSQGRKVEILVVELVSIPERVWGGLERSTTITLDLITIVSIPERVWGGLERAICGYIYNASTFQSLRGFGVGWSLTIHG